MNLTPFFLVVIASSLAGSMLAFLLLAISQGVEANVDE